MPALALIYPCMTLARAIDPLRLAMAIVISPADAGHCAEVRQRIAELFAGIEETQRTKDGNADQRWYWAALLFSIATTTPLRSWLGSATKRMASSTLNRTTTAMPPMVSGST